MPHKQPLLHDRQLLCVVGIWALILSQALVAGLDLPTSPYVTFAPDRFSYVFPLFGLLVPPVLVVANHIFTRKNFIQRFVEGGLQRLIDRRFGVGAAERFWRRLQPLFLLGAWGFVLGSAGLLATLKAHGPAAAFEATYTYLAFGAGFFIGALIERYAFKAAHAA